MKIVCISDTHFQHQKMEIPAGDLLLHAGDFSKIGLPYEVEKFNEWLGTLPHPHKVVIAGNHDFLFEKQPELARSLLTNAIYLEDSGVEVAGIKIWGSPITPWFFDWAFNRLRGADIRKHWDLIPKGIDILITHGPPFGILDMTVRQKPVGCEDLWEIVQEIQPKLHLFGHIHEARGQMQVGNTLFVNAAMLDVNYDPVYEAIVIEW
jgi:Icc-related predicted phosphoesterase